MKALNGPHPWWHRRFSSGVNKLKKLSFDLLSGAWFHKKALTDEVVDETPDVDTSRTWHKARALQFTGAEHVSIPKTYPSTDTPTSFEVTLEIITGNSIVGTQDIFCTDDAGQAAGIQLRIESYLSDWRFGLRVGNVVARDTSFAVQTNTRYILVISYDGTDATLTVNEATNLTITPTSAIAGAGLIMLGRRYTSLGNYFNGILGYVKVKEDNIVIGEYAFEEGDGTTCYNRVMNNFHGTINNATISTFRVEDVRITNGDQGTFLNTEGYTDNNKIYSSTDYPTTWQAAGGAIIEQELSFEGKEGVKKVTFPAGTYSNATLQAFHNNALLNLRTTTTADDHTLTYYFPSGQQNNWFRLTSGDSKFQAVEDTWTTVSFSISTNDARVFMVDGDVDSNLDITTTEDVVIYIGDYVVTEPNVYVPRPRVTDIPLYNAGKYAYYIPDHANNFIELNNAFAGLTNDGDWMEFGIATVGTGEPDSKGATWAISIDGSDNSSFYARIDNTDFRFYGPANSYRLQGNVNLTDRDFYSFRITKNYNTTTTVNNPPPGTIEVFDRDGNLIKSQGLEAINGNEGTYTFDRFFPNTYSTDFILAYLKLSDGTVWNGANDFNGGVNITNTGTGNVTKIFFESVDEDVLGNPLTYKGQVAQPLSLVNSNGAYLETPHKVDFSQIDVSDFTLTFYAYLDSSLSGSGTNREILSNQNTTQGLLYFSDARLYYFAGGHNNSYDFSSAIPDEEVVDKWQKFSIIRNDSANTLSFVVENDSRTVTTDPAQSGAVAPYNMIGRMYSTPGLGGSLAWVSLHSKAMTIEEARAIDPYNMDTDSLEIFLVPSAGNGSTVYDVSGNNNHGTIRNATLSDFWIKQNEFHWNLKKGFSEVYSFDGVDDNIIPDTPLSFTGDFFIDFDVFTLASEFYIISSGGEYFRISSGSLMFRVDSNINTITTDITTNTRYIGRLQRISGVITCTLNGVNYPVVTTNTTIDFSYLGSNGSASGYTQGIINYINVNNEYIATGINFPNATINGGLQSVKVPYTINGNYTNPAGKWHNDAETEINFPHTAKLQVINEQFNVGPFFYKNAINYTLDASAGVDGWGRISGGTNAGNIDGVTDGTTSYDNVLQHTCGAGVGSQHGFSKSLDDLLQGGSTQNQTFYAYATFRLPSAGNIDGVRLWTGYGAEGSYTVSPGNTNWTSHLFGPFDLSLTGSSSGLRIQGVDGGDFTPNVDCNGELIQVASVYIIQMPTLKDVTFADMYQTWYDYEYLHRLFAHFVVPNQVHNILAYTDELTAAQKQKVYDYLQKNYHPIYTPYSTRVLADGGTLAAGQTNTLTIIDSI